jgi:hypothetical protein
MIKQSTLDALSRYVKEGIPTGDFLRAVLENKLKESFAYADNDNLSSLREIVSYIYNKLPLACQGSPEKVTAWIAKKKAERGQKEEWT